MSNKYIEKYNKKNLKLYNDLIDNLNENVVNEIINPLNKIKKIINLIDEKILSTTSNYYLIGGAVRDTLLNKNINDLDFFVNNNNHKYIKNLILNHKFLNKVEKSKLLNEDDFTHLVNHYKSHILSKIENYFNDDIISKDITTELYSKLLVLVLKNNGYDVFSKNENINDIKNKLFNTTEQNGYKNNIYINDVIKIKGSSLNDKKEYDMDLILSNASIDKYLSIVDCDTNKLYIDFNIKNFFIKSNISNINDVKKNLSIHNGFLNDLKNNTLTFNQDFMFKDTEDLLLNVRLPKMMEKFPDRNLIIVKNSINTEFYNKAIHLIEKYKLKKEFKSVDFKETKKFNNKL